MSVYTLSQQSGQAIHMGLSTDTKPPPVAGQTYLTRDTGQLFDNDGVTWAAVLKHIQVASLADFPAPAGDVITLEDNHAYHINGTVDLGANRIVCGVANIIVGTDRSNDKIISTTSGVLFTCDSTSVVKTIFTIESLTISAPSATLVNMTGTGSNTQNFVMISCTIQGFTSLGTLASCTAVAVRNSTIIGPITTSGFTITGQGVGATFLFFRDCSLRGCAGTMFDFGTSVWARIVFGRNFVTTAATQTFLSGQADGSNVTIAGKLADNSFDGAGTFVSGILRNSPLWNWHDNGGITNTMIPISLLATGTPDGTKFIRDDGALAVPAGGGGSGAAGNTTVDFGAFPGAVDASATVTGQASIVAGSVVEAWLRVAATADHSEDEHRIEAIRVTAGTIVAGTGFTIYASLADSTPEKDISKQSGRAAPRLYGLYSVSWRWV